MDETQIKHVLEAALLAAGRPLTLDEIGEIFASKRSKLARGELRQALDSLAEDYDGRGIELREVASGFRIQIKSAMSDWLQPLWEQRAPRYTRALLETLALIAYRQPITRGEIEEVRGVVVSTNIVRTLLERNWIRVVGHRDVPGKPEMFGTTKEFLDYFGLKSLDELPTLAELPDGLPEPSPQGDLIEGLELAAPAGPSGPDLRAAPDAATASGATDGEDAVDAEDASDAPDASGAPPGETDAPRAAAEAHAAGAGRVADAPDAKRASDEEGGGPDDLPDAASDTV